MARYSSVCINFVSGRNFKYNVQRTINTGSTIGESSSSGVAKVWVVGDAGEVMLEIGASLILQLLTRPVVPEWIFLDLNGSMAQDRLSLTNQVK